MQGVNYNESEVKIIKYYFETKSVILQLECWQRADENTVSESEYIISWVI